MTAIAPKPPLVQYQYRRLRLPELTQAWWNVILLRFAKVSFCPSDEDRGKAAIVFYTLAGVRGGNAEGVRLAGLNDEQLEAELTAFVCSVPRDVLEPACEYLASMSLYTDQFTRWP